MSDMDFETRRVIIETLTKERDAAIEALRDRFAMSAIQGLCSQCDATGMSSWLPEDAVKYAYSIADAMMEARK